MSCKEKTGLRGVYALTKAPVKSLFEYGLKTGGPGVMSVGWIIISFFSLSGSKNKHAFFNACHVN